ncbi:MAG: anthranilate phosphoribosyltransferase [Chloroflexota bacterium]|nr:anthranilate phosphoribosyltransferase [Chloroflexota bacterium]
MDLPTHTVRAPQQVSHDAGDRRANTTSSVAAHPPDHEAFIPFVKAVGRGEKLKRDLTYQESVEAMRLILQGKALEGQIGAFLIAQRVKGEAVDEILGFTDVIRDEFIRQISPRVDGLLDLATPYDGKAKTAQLAPAVAIVLAEAGVPVVLHGDEGVPTKEGIGPGLVFQALGIPIDLEPALVERVIERVGIGYLDARRFAPAWHNLIPLRRQFGLRTVLNTVEKLFNPANAPYQVSGFFHANYIERIRTAQSGEQLSYIVQGEEGSIEMRPGRRTPIYAVEPQDDLILDMDTLDLPEGERIFLEPSARRHAQLNASVLAGKAGPAADQVALTAGTILTLLGAAADLADGLRNARSILTTGAAQRRLEHLQSFTTSRQMRSS